MRASSDFRVVLEWAIAGSDSVIATVITLEKLDSKIELFDV